MFQDVTTPQLISNFASCLEYGISKKDKMIYRSKAVMRDIEEFILIIRADHHVMELYFYGELVIRVDFAPDNKIWAEVSIIMDCSKFRPTDTDLIHSAIYAYKMIRGFREDRGLPAFIETFH